MKKLIQKVKALHADEQGADLIEYVLIIAAIALPVLLLIIFFKDDIEDWMRESYDEVKGHQSNPEPF